MTLQESLWRWQGWSVGWSVAEEQDTSQELDTPAVLLIHGFGANTRHWD